MVYQKTPCFYLLATTFYFKCLLLKVKYGFLVASILSEKASIWNSVFKSNSSNQVLQTKSMSVVRVAILYNVLLAIRGEFFPFSFFFNFNFIFIFFSWGRLQGWKVDTEGLGNEWDWSAWCDIPKESI